MLMQRKPCGRGEKEKGKIIAQQLNKRIMPNPAVN